MEIPPRQLEDVPELIHRIQLLLPQKEAARTCVLSKSWLHAWSTIPNLSFPRYDWVFRKQEINYNNFIDQTLLRYKRDNVPLESIYLAINIWKHEFALRVNKRIQTVTSHSSLKELHLSIMCQLPSAIELDGIFNGENLNTISVIGHEVIVTTNPVIKCVSLRVLELTCVNISEEVLENLLSTCTLLEKISLSFCKGLNTIKVKNLCHLRELIIKPYDQNEILDIDDVPSLAVNLYDSSFKYSREPRLSFGRVTEMYLNCLIMDAGLFDIIKSSFPFLEDLVLQLDCVFLQNIIDFTCIPLKRLTIDVFESWPNCVRVYAPNLSFFCYKGVTIPTLLFQTIVPEQISLKVELKRDPVESSFFLKMRETLNLSSEFHLEIEVQSDDFVEPYLNIDDMRKRISFPATNVQQLSLKISSEELGSWEESRFFDAFFEVCHPNYVKAYQRVSGINYFCELMLSEVIEKKTIRMGHWRDYLKDVEIKNPHNGKWQVLPNYCESILDESSRGYWYLNEFKLNWC